MSLADQLDKNVLDHRFTDTEWDTLLTKIASLEKDAELGNAARHIAEKYCHVYRLYLEENVGDTVLVSQDFPTVDEVIKQALCQDDTPKEVG